MSFAALWESLLPIGRDGLSGGYRRFSWTPEDAACRAWFTQALLLHSWQVPQSALLQQALLGMQAPWQSLRPLAQVPLQGWSLATQVLPHARKPELQRMPHLSLLCT